MPLNPLQFSEQVLADFLRYQVTAYPLADERMSVQLRQHLALGRTRQSPLVRGPYVSLSRAFAQGATVQQLVNEGLLHPHLPRIAPFHELYGHQEQAIRAIAAGKSTLISTGTGSGKTECFLYPIIGQCLELRDGNASPGIVAVLVYPMNALAIDQLGRLRWLLAGSGISFGLYVGSTPDREADVAGERLRTGASRADYEAAVERARWDGRSVAVHPVEECASRERMRTAESQPRILLTNVKQLELLLTRQADVQLFDGARLDYLVFDEAHTWGGAEGAEAACLVRRLRAFCSRGPRETVCIGTSATIADPVHGLEPARDFASRFFGVDRDTVAIVTESYRGEEWAQSRRWPPAPSGDPEEHLSRVLAAADPRPSDADEPGEREGSAIAAAYTSLCGDRLAGPHVANELFGALVANELCRTASEVLARPQPLDRLVEQVSTAAARPVSAEELLCWLVLGAAARRDGRPLLRPVVHAFVRGMGGAVVTFEPGDPTPQLSMLTADGRGAPAERVRMDLLSCTTCGQHYFVHYVQDLRVTEHGLEGGEAAGESRLWRPLDRTAGGNRVVLLDALIGDDDEDGDPRNTRPVYLCAVCGALHPESRARCESCGREEKLVPLFAAVAKEKRPGQLTTCLSCRAPGSERPGAWREPARPVRAVTVADVHVLAQNIVHRARRKRLLVFADNRQDAAFQAGWMRDHARRFRIRSLMIERITQGALSPGDLIAHLDRVLEDDDDLSRALIPEVWNHERKDATSLEHRRERRWFLKTLVMRELATGVKQRLGLEPWGRLRVAYFGLAPELTFIREWAARLGLDPERLSDGVAGLLDTYRRSSFLIHDAETEVFGRFWNDGDREIIRGYLPKLRGVPKGLKLQRSAGDDDGRIDQWLSEHGDSRAREIARKFGVPKDEVDAFLTALWDVLTAGLKLLVPVTLKGQRGRALSGCNGARQIDAGRLIVEPHSERWRCQRCRRMQVRPTPHDLCLAWRCEGKLVLVADDPDDYDLLALKEGFELLRPAEHSAQVPHDDRERLERGFKSDRGPVNTLVCTPTLEMGVDIGGLDSVLLRNVPPTPANYWQRVGRAGRRHRLAVNLTYARDTSHDRQYFTEPLKLLEGRIEPPRFNLRNEVMLGKHVRAAVVTRLRQLAREGSGLAEHDREEITSALAHAFPTFVREYLFEPDGGLRRSTFDVTHLHTVVTRHADDLCAAVERAFRETWPTTDLDVVEPRVLREVVLGTADALDRVIRQVKKRVDWCDARLRELHQTQATHLTLDEDQEALRRRLERVIKRLKGVEQRQSREQEGYDDRFAYNALAVEGFFPGYGLEGGTIRANALSPRGGGGPGEFILSRSPVTALREFVPGNLLYANGGQYATRFYHFEATEPLVFDIDVARGAVREVGSATPDGQSVLGADRLTAVPICESDLSFRSHISDQEDHRFQMPVAIFGEELHRHGGGTLYAWGEQELHHRRGQQLRLVNVGAASLVRERRLGYPLSIVGNQARSPYASDRELKDFDETMQKRHGRPVRWCGFYTDVVADALLLQGAADRAEAYSVLEALRTGMGMVLDMERDDLEVLVVARPGEDAVDGFLYDPMPGGSGLLEQACDRWADVVTAAIGVVEGCAAACERSCIDCLHTFRNAFQHEFLDRHLAARHLREWGTRLELTSPIPQRMPAEAPRGDHQPAVGSEGRLRDILIRAGFAECRWQESIDLGQPLGSTTPDAFFQMDDMPGLCIYVDGLSGRLHGNPETAARDRMLREALRSRGFQVIEIAASHLDDRESMQRHVKSIARWLLGPEGAARVGASAEWWGEPASWREGP